MTLLPAQHPLITRYAEIREATAARYGPTSQAVVFLLYEELVSLRAVLAQDRDCPVAARRVRELAADIQSRFDDSGLRDTARPHHVLLCADPPLIAYDRDVFDRQYLAALRATGRSARTIRSAAEAFAELSTAVSYIYAIDDLGSLRVWPEPFTLAELVFGRALDRPVPGPRIVHPMLVPERLRVRAAGEMVLLGTPGSPVVVGNLKSGHFRPPPQSGAVFRSVIREVFAITDDADIDVFTMPAS
ncbi:hypothetical protein [Kitasatospora sp. NBC_01266]|uniref:hypothetical protein n=1 Tax=Kitasatospora sp. NBC_01266 TaxID=2903572 RepID=UPI002E316F76|nr:hypothetical protein [Kitasatospora sp. NBC_01266]